MPRAVTRLTLAAAALAALGASPRAAPAPSTYPPSPPSSSPSSSSPSPAADAAFLDALTWGASPSSFAELRALGRERWLRAQLHPPAGQPMPEAARAQLDALTPKTSLFDRAQALAAQSRAADAEPDPDAKQAAKAAFQGALNAAARDAAGAWVLRALYDPAQLRERLTWFWFNRFNVFQGKATLRAAVGDYLDTAIRPHALGRFRDLLLATLRHPAMLRYLDNADNAAGKVNENYAREIMERHTMGAGSGYTQGDVEALARVLTGVGILLNPEAPRLHPDRARDFVRDGLFAFNPDRHDYGDKPFLGRTVHGRGWPEVEEAVDLIARAPATALSVSRGLVAYFAGRPDEALAGRLAAVFTRTDGDIAAVMDTLAHDPALAAARGTGAADAPFKDPARYVFSALRMAYDGRVIRNPGPVIGWLDRLGEGLFKRPTPDGYPLDGASWSGPGQLAARFEVARQIGSGPGGLFKAPVGALVGMPPGMPNADRPDEPAFPSVANALYFSTLEGGLSEPTRAALAQAASQQEWNTLYLASPEFMR